MPDFSVHLSKGVYMREISALRQHLDLSDRKGYLTVALYPKEGDDHVELRLRRSDGYVVGFKGADQWYYLEGDKPEGEKGGDTGVGGNYNNLETVDTVTKQDFEAVLGLGEFQKGVKLKTRFIVLVAAVISEAVRSAVVATYFIGLFNDIDAVSVVNLAHLKKTYFLKWEKHTKEGNPDVLWKK